MFFGNGGSSSSSEAYGTVIAAAELIDGFGWDAIWTPERHFHSFGGLFPNPAVLGAALAMITRQCQIRGGSVVGPLHDPLRIAEEWAVVDQLSAGRVGLALGSGWNAKDFVLAPTAYQDRAHITYEQIETLRSLWDGKSQRRPSGAGVDVDVVTYPRPIQPRLPLWLTASGRPETFRKAGSSGVNVLTHLLSQGWEELEQKIKYYREAHVEPGGIVSVMLHTYIAPTDALARRRVRGPLSAYLRESLSLELRAAAAGGSVSGGRQLGGSDIDDDMVDDIVQRRFDSLCDGNSLIGSPATCATVLHRLADLGVDEVACLVDFGLEKTEILESLGQVNAVMSSSRMG